MSKNGPKTTKNSEKQGKSPRISAKRSENSRKRPSSRAEANRAYYEENQERMKQLSRERYSRMTPAERKLKSWRQQAQPTMPKPGSKRALDTRKVALAQAFCSWSDIDEVVRIYMACEIMNELGWGKYRVDHTVPLSAKTVCGLHTHTNLQVITEDENNAKGHHFWPGMPDQNWGTIDLLLGRS